MIRKIKKLYEERIGLNPSAVSNEIWTSLVAERMQTLGIENTEEYWCKLILSPEEFQELVELLIVPETWFFREGYVFDFLVNYLRQHNKEKKGLSYHILSLPCCGGEEPYSIAMALLGAGFETNAFVIDAVDISYKSLELGEQAVYRENSFRGKDLSFRDRYFEELEGEQYRLKDEIKKCVNFRFGNIMSPQFGEGMYQYDVIFFRNLLIYFHRDAQKQSMETLKKLLKPNGILIVASSEAETVVHTSLFCHGEKPYVFCLKKAEKAFIKPKKEPLASISAIKEGLLGENSKAFMLQVCRKQNFDSLAKAVQLADEGLFEDAASICLEFLKDHGANAKAYFLLGLIQHAAAHDDQAEDYFLKTVYLEPKHYEALIYLKLLAEKRGDKNQAELFFQRASKAALK